MDSIKKLHAHLILTGLYKCSFSISKVLIGYALSPAYLSYATLVFDQVEEPNTFIWNTMIRGFAHSEAPSDAIHLYDHMRAEGVKQDERTFPFLLKACASVPAIVEGERIHSHVLKLGLVSDVFVSNSLIHLYTSCGYLDCARKAFDEMLVKDLVSWNSLICGYSQKNCLKEVLGLFQAMQEEELKGDKVTMVKVVSACTHLGDWDSAEAMIKYIEENHVEVDVYLGNTLIDYYGRRGLVESARRVFGEMKERNIVTLNAMITTYAKAGDIVSARKIFEGMPERDLISWSSMITGYSQARQFSDALMLFRKMQKTKIEPDEIVVVSVLSACAHLGALNQGMWIHNHIKRKNIKTDVYVGNALIDMYSKCGCVLQAFELFSEMKQKDTLSCNLIILGLATNGYVDSALEVFSNMLQEGYKPNELTFLGVLKACALTGVVDKGFEYFNSMREVHGLEPQMKHYGCMVDLLSRAGELDKAHKFITEMPMTPDPIVWRTLLGACNIHGNVEMAEVVTQKLTELDPGNSGNYVLLSNTYASAERWGDAMKLREMMQQTDIQKIPGCSSIDIS